MKTTISYQPLMETSNENVCVQQPSPGPTNHVAAQTPRRRPIPIIHVFNILAGRITGLILICCGMGSITGAVAHMLIGCGGLIDVPGVLSAVLFSIPCGILGIFTMKKYRGVIIAYLVMCILSAMAACYTALTNVALVLSGPGTGCFCYEDTCVRAVVIINEVCNCLLAIIHFVEIVTAIVGSCYCCAGFHRSYKRTTSMPVVNEGPTQMSELGIQEPSTELMPPAYTPQPGEPSP